MDADKIVAEIKKVMDERVDYLNSEAAGIGSGQSKEYERMGYISAEAAARATSLEYQLCERLLEAGSS